MCAKKIRYQHRPQVKLEVLAKKVEKLTQMIDMHKKNLIAVIQSNNKHMDYLAKFARHDMGNAIQNISATIETIDGDVDEVVIKALRASVDNLNRTLINLGKLILYSPSKKIHAI